MTRSEYTATRMADPIRTQMHYARQGRITEESLLEQERERLDGVVLAGGSTHIPMVQRLVGAHFNRPLLSSLPPDRIVSMGAALLARHSGLDPLFTPAGYQAYADDLLTRMTNPHLRDLTERITRDTPRKLAWDDRLVGTMRLALDAGIAPRRFALAVAAALETLDSAASPAAQFDELWPAPDLPPGRKARLVELILEAQTKLKTKDASYGKL